MENVVSYNTPELNNKSGEYVDVPALRHAFIVKQKVNSQYVNLLDEFLLNIKEIFGENVVIQSLFSNLMIPNVEYYGKQSIPHIDIFYPKNHYDKYNCYTGLYYLNDCSGDTVLYEECVRDYSSDYTLTEMKRVSPEKNKFIFWEYNRLHSAPASCNKPRFVINVNFFTPKE